MPLVVLINLSLNWALLDLPSEKRVIGSMAFCIFSASHACTLCLLPFFS
jgi:hypothetical protein